MNIWIPPKADPDSIAPRLIQLGRLARAMPPAWDGAAVAHRVMGNGFEDLGRILPGRGLYLNTDFKTLGIKKQLPFVYERSITNWLRDLIATLAMPWGNRPAYINEIGAISTYDGIISSRGGGKAADFCVSKSSFTTVATSWSSMARAGGIPPTITFNNIPGGSALDVSNAGAWGTITGVSGGDKAYILTFGYVAAQQINCTVLVDLLIAAGNISMTGTSNTVNTTALTRYTTGEGNLVTLEVTTGLGTGTPNLAGTYTDQGGGSPNTFPNHAMVASLIAQRLFPTTYGFYMQFAAGDYGVRSVQTITLSAGMTAGVAVLYIFRPLIWMPALSANLFAERDSTVQIDGLVEWAQTSGAVLGCLSAFVLTNTTSTGIVNYFIRACKG